MTANIQSCHSDFHKIHQAGRESGFTHKLDAKPEKRLFEGTFANQNEASGLRIHTVDAVELSNNVSSLHLLPSVNVAVLLKGRVDFCLGTTWYHFDADANGPQCFATCVPVPTLWQRRMEKQNNVSKVVVSASFDWLRERDRENQLISKLQSHGAGVWHWPLNDNIESLAQSLMDLSQQKTLFSNLMREAKSTELLMYGLNMCDIENAHDSLNNSFLYNAINKKSEVIRSHLETYIVHSANAINVDLRDLEIQLRMSSSTLQRTFKKAFGITISDYVRVRKLEIARDSLRKGHTSIGEAAFMAGYGHASNFSKAFKQAFGITPGEYAKAK